MEGTTELRRWGFTLLMALAIAAAFSAPLAAQRITGQISGTVNDESGGVLPGVTVTLTGETIVGERPVITGENGSYRFVNLPPGAYDLRFELDGFAPVSRQGVRVGVGSTTDESITLAVGGLSEAIVVIAENPVIDTESSEVSTNYQRVWVEAAPVARQSFNDLVAAAPGSLRGSDESRRTMVYGSSYDENSFQLDGADINDNFFNEQLAQPNIDVIEEIEVLSLGAPAEYGNLTGAVYNIVTRQGTNNFHGDINFFSQSDSLTDTNTTAEENGGFPYHRDTFRDISVQVGGPIKRDRLWFFASYQNQENSDSVVGVDPAIGTNVFESDRVFGKLNIYINPRHSLVVSYSEDESNDGGGIGTNSAPSTAVNRFGETPTPGLGYTAVLSSKTLFEFRYTGFYGTVELGPSAPGQPRDLARFLNLDTGFLSGGHYYFYDLTPKRTTLTAKVSHLADDFLKGSHDFRFGVQYNASEAGGLYGYNDLILTYGGADGLAYGYGYTRTPFSYSGNAEGTGVFADDTWHVSERLTLNLGVRFDSNRAFSKQQGELDANGNPTGVVFPEVEHYTWEYISPRLGFNYLLTEDGRNVLKGHFGRYHRAITTGEFANVIGPSIKPIFAGPYELETDTFLDLFQISDNSNLLVDPGYDSPRTDQFFLTYERRLTDRIGLNVNVIHKRGRDFAAWQVLNGTFELVPFTDDVGEGASGKTFDVFRLVSDREDLAFEITNRPEMDTDIYAASVGIVRPLANQWSLNASLTWLQSEGRTTDSGGGAAAEQRGGLQFRTFGRNPNDFVNSGGRLRGDVPWQLKAQFVYDFEKIGLLTALNLSMRSGANLVRRLRLDNDVTNLSSTILLEDRGDSGRLPSATFVDVRVQKNFALGRDFELGLIAEVFNLLNDDAHETVQSSIVTSSAFNVPDGFILPRRMQLGVKLRF